MGNLDAYLRKRRVPQWNEKERKQTLEGNVATISSLEEGVLYYKKASDESDWKFCIRSTDEKGKIMESCHVGIGGRYIIQQLYIHSNNIMHLSK